MAREKYSGRIPAFWSRPNSSGAWDAQKRNTRIAMNGKSVSYLIGEMNSRASPAAPNWPMSARIPSVSSEGRMAIRVRPTGMTLDLALRPSP